MVNEDAEQTEVPILGGDGAAGSIGAQAQATRFHSPFELFEEMPRVRTMTQHRPSPVESHLDFLIRLRGSATPEEAVTFTAFAVVPELAVWWAYECLRLESDELSPADRELMDLVWTWNKRPSAENRYRTMRTALYAPVRSPQVFLGLAVGWSGGGIAPNDPAQVVLHRAPQAINSAVLSNLAKGPMTLRGARLARVIDRAEKIFEF